MYYYYVFDVIKIPSNGACLCGLALGFPASLLGIHNVVNRFGSIITTERAHTQPQASLGLTTLSYRPTDSSFNIRSFSVFAFIRLTHIYILPPQPLRLALHSEEQHIRVEELRLEHTQGLLTSCCTH